MRYSCYTRDVYKYQTCYSSVVDCIETDELVAANSLCLSTVNRAKNYHLLPERKEELGAGRWKPRIQDTGVCLYIIGGEIHSYVFNTLECYSFDSDCWTSLSCLNKPRDGLGVATYNGRIFAAGGKLAIAQKKICFC